MEHEVKTIIITGGAGFIGSHLTKNLLEKGHYVLCIDNMFTGSKKNIAPFTNNPRFEFIRHDVVLPILLEAEEIYHLASDAVIVTPTPPQTDAEEGVIVKAAGL